VTLLSITMKSLDEPSGRMSECLLFNAKWAIFQLYHGEN
jgi:hypothetical protein